MTLKIAHYYYPQTRVSAVYGNRSSEPTLATAGLMSVSVLSRSEWALPSRSSGSHTEQRHCDAMYRHE